MACKLFLTAKVVIQAQVKFRYTLAWDEVLSCALGSKAPQALMAADQGMNEARNGAAISMPIIIWVARTPGKV
jgi:hypothetical protein